MPKNCCVPGCKASYNRGEYTPIFTFPRDEERVRLWKKAVPKENLIVNQNTAVCINHFPEDQILREIRVSRPDALSHRCLPEYTVYWDLHQCFCAIDDIDFECEKEEPAEPEERPTLDKRIVGGDSVAFINHPYMLALEMREELLCGATIISTKWAVTAAHCVEGFHLSGMKLRGHTSLREKGGYLYRVIAAIIHHGFDEETFAYDIALLRSHQLFRKNDAIKLPKSNERLAVGTMVTVVGWGNTEENGTMSMTLRDVRVPIVSYKECRRAYGDVVTINMYCAGYPEGLKDACQADSGGPLVHGEYLVGIVSFGQGCARPKTPGVYTRVSAMREWIKKQIGI